MRAFLKLTLLLALFASAGLAFMPLATVSGNQPFLLSGHSMASTGITSWPVVAGDVLTTDKSPVIVYFRDGSSVKLAAASSIKLNGSAEAPQVLLTAGTLDYKLVAGSQVNVRNTDLPASDQAAASGAGAPKGSLPSSAATHAAGKGTLLGTLSNPAVLTATSLVGGAGAGLGIANTLAARLPPVSSFQ